MRKTLIASFAVALVVSMAAESHGAEERAAEVSPAPAATDGGRPDRQAAPSSAERQILIRAQIVDFNVSKLRAARTDLVSKLRNPQAETLPKRDAADFEPTPRAAFLVGERSLLEGIFENRRIAQVVSSPTLAVLAGLTAEFQSGGEVLNPVNRGAGQPKFRRERFGTELDVTPTLLPEQRVHLALRARLSCLDASLDSSVGTDVMHGIRASETTTGFTLPLGKTMALYLGTQNCRSVAKSFFGLVGETTEEQIDTYLFVTPEIFEFGERPVVQTANRPTDAQAAN